MDSLDGGGPGRRSTRGRRGAPSRRRGDRAGIEASPAQVAAKALANPILFVTQVPIPGDFTTVGSAFGNQLAAVDSAARGGDLWIRYPDGTREEPDARRPASATSGMQGAGVDRRARAVRALERHEGALQHGHRRADAAVSVGRRTTGRSTRSRASARARRRSSARSPISRRTTTTSARSTAPTTASSSPPTARAAASAISIRSSTSTRRRRPSPASGASIRPPAICACSITRRPDVFTPSIDSFGRVIFTRWDHLQRDQQADGDAMDGAGYGTFNYADEIGGRGAPRPAGSRSSRSRAASRTGSAGGHAISQGNSINQFFPWQINEDGTSEETLNHIGRHELHGYFDREHERRPDLSEFIGATAAARIRTRSRTSSRSRRIRRSRASTSASTRRSSRPTPRARSSASIAEPALTADQIAVTYITTRSTRDVTDEGARRRPSARGTIAIRCRWRTARSSPSTRAETARRRQRRHARRRRSRATPSASRRWWPQGGVYVPAQPLTAGIHRERLLLGSRTCW